MLYYMFVMLSLCSQHTYQPSWFSHFLLPTTISLLLLIAVLCIVRYYFHPEDLQTSRFGFESFTVLLVRRLANMVSVIKKFVPFFL